MIFVASQRGGAKQLGLHLLRAEENEHVEVHEIRGFVSNDVVGALKEAQAISKGTRCKQFLFSVSLNPPPGVSADIAVFEATLARIEERHGLTGQPRIVVFHEKDGRRHAHAVWSRIDAEEMKAVPLPHFKLKLRDLGREIFLEQDWKMPRGYMNSQEADPRNFTLAEWQQARRLGLHGRDLKQMFQECWAVSDSRASFAAAIEERGFKLARGDRRGFVAVSHDGEVLSIARYTGKTAKDVAAQLGDPAGLPCVEEALARFARELTPVVRSYLDEAKAAQERELATLHGARRQIVSRHRERRASLTEAQGRRQEAEAQVRAARLRKGVRGLWDRVTGRRRETLLQNRHEAREALQRDASERQTLIASQLTERRALQSKIRAVIEHHIDETLEIRRELARLSAQGETPTLKATFGEARDNAAKRGRGRQHRSRDHSDPTPEM